MPNMGQMRGNHEDIALFMKILQLKLELDTK